MDPTTEIVTGEVIATHDSGTTLFSVYTWGLSFLDVADQVYYQTNPIGMESDYAIIWGAVGRGEVGCFDTGSILELSLMNAVDCKAILDTIPAAVRGFGNYSADCVMELPNPKSNTIGHTKVGNVFTYDWELDFKSCGYEFNPYELQSCKPLTMTSYGSNRDDTCLAGSEDELVYPPPYESWAHHTWAKIQIDGFPTNAPTYSPSQAPSNAPTSPPSNAPSSAPTGSPVSPTVSPTFPTNAPTFSPSAAPTPKPTQLPTKNFTIYDEPPCAGLHIRHLEEMFPREQALRNDQRFTQVIDKTTGLSLISNQRRIWTNGILDVYFQDRFSDGGDWIITNGSYSAISIIDSNFNNSLVYDTSVPNAISPNSLPGPYPRGYVYYDHFPHDNILAKPDLEITLYFECNDTSFPTRAPTPEPTTAEPTDAPTTETPTQAPTAICSTLCIRDRDIDTNQDVLTAGAPPCAQNITQLFEGCYERLEDQYGHAYFEGIESDESNSSLGNLFYWSDFLEKWVIETEVSYGAEATEPGGLFPPIIDDGIGPPVKSEYLVRNTKNWFSPPCNIMVKYICDDTRIPTEAPSPAPTTPSPTTAEPTGSPTLAPSAAPSLAPSLAPSYSPSIAPTPAPTVVCNGLSLSGTSSALDGLYRKETEGTAGNETFTQIAGRDNWKQVRGGDGEIFWSESSLHGSWVINSDQLGEYWLSVNRPDFQPNLVGQWEKYIGALPFIETTETLTIECFETLPPTPAPTAAPSLAPTAAPSLAPSIAPTLAPSLTPTAAPTESPTPSPTTLSPTLEPTMEPTFIPTMEPTAEVCPYLLIKNLFDEPELDRFVGLYLYEDLNNDWRRYLGADYYRLWRSDSNTDSSYRWTISNTIENIVTIDVDEGGLERPPDLSDRWIYKRNHFPVSYNHTLDIECTNTTAPTAAPSFSPSLAPTGAPTSSCMGLYFRNMANNSFKHNGWFQRQDDYTINGHKYWISVDLSATIEYVRGYWHLMERDNDKTDDEDPVMLTFNGSDLLSPPSGQWIYSTETLLGTGIAMVDITCDASFSPTPDPSPSPTPEPTEYVALTWATCPDSRLYFSFITNVSTAVYWPEPTLNNHLYDTNMTSDYTPGDDLPTGLTNIEYIATDSYGTEITCSVSVIVIGGAPYPTNYDYCKKESFHIEIKFNNSFYILPDNQEVDLSEAITKYQGIIYDPRLQIDEQNCYVTAEEVTKYDTIVIEDEPAKSSFLGLEAVNIIWEILVLLLILILLCLVCECLYRCYKERKDAQDAKDEEQTANLLANADDGPNDSAAGTGNVELQEAAQEPVADD